MKLIKNASLVFPDRVEEGKGIIFSERIKGILEQGEIIRREKEKNLEVIDAGGLYLAPGFIDIHIHGSAGHDTMDATHEALKSISLSLARTGVTSFLATTMTMPEEKIKDALDNIRATMARGTEGARVLGAHGEGPFINPDYKGAQAEKDIIKPDISLIEEYIDVLKLVTVAPEMEGAEEVIHRLSEAGVVVSVGHSAAGYDDIIRAREWGLSHATHLFNAMTGIHHRRPGIVGAVLTSDITCELIADLIHIHPAVLRLVIKSKDLDQIILVTDQMEAGCLQEGEYSLGGQKVVVKDGSARLENGQLAGSILTLNRAVKNILDISELTLPDAIRMVTGNPARRLGLAKELGQLLPGMRADLVLFDEKIDIKATFVEGEKVY